MAEIRGFDFELCRQILPRAKGVRTGEERGGTSRSRGHLIDEVVQTLGPISESQSDSGDLVQFHCICLGMVSSGLVRAVTECGVFCGLPCFCWVQRGIREVLVS